MNSSPTDFRDPSSNINNYITKIDQLTEVDLGDFKRKVNQYLLRIEQLLGASLRGEQQDIIADIRKKVVYYPLFDIEDSREYTCKALQQLIKSLK